MTYQRVQDHYLMIPAAFRKARKELGLSQEQLARALYVSKTTIHKWELGYRRVFGSAAVALEFMLEKYEREKGFRPSG